MTREQAQLVLLRAFVASGELPKDMQELLILLIRQAAPSLLENQVAVTQS